jgi:hypothetical protein
MECCQCGIRKNGGGKVREGDEQRVEYQRFEAFDEPDMQKKLKRSPFAARHDVCCGRKARFDMAEIWDAG